MTAEVRVNPAFHRFLIGRNGVNLRDILDRTGARIVFPSQSDHDNDCILIIGQQDSISKAKAELEARIKDLVGLALLCRPKPIYCNYHKMTNCPSQRFLSNISVNS